MPSVGEARKKFSSFPETRGRAAQVDRIRELEEKRVSRLDADYRSRP